MVKNFTTIYFIKEVTTGNIMKISSNFLFFTELRIDHNPYSTSPIWLTDSLDLARTAKEQLVFSQLDKANKYVYKIYSFVAEENEEL